LVNAFNAVCSTSIDTFTAISPIPMTWVGATDTNWSNAANWSCGFVPGASDDVTIPFGTANRPSISAAVSVHGLTVAAGAIVKLNTSSVLNVGSNLVNNGYLKGAGVTSLNGTSAQTISGVGAVDYLDINNSTGVTVTTASLVTVKNTLSVSSGTFATGDSVVMASDSLTTARVASLPSTGSSITGNMKVMQFIPGGYRRYRFWSHPFDNYIALSQLENYIDLTGIGGTANGFSYTLSNAPSVYRYNPLVGNSAAASDPGWRAFTSTFLTADSNRLHQYQGIRLFVRGAKGQGLFGETYTPMSVTVAQIGHVNQGRQVIHMQKGTAANQDYNQFGNPYPSSVDLGTVIYNAKVAGNITGASFYMWNPYLGAGGQFAPIPIGTTVAIPYYMQENTSFQVRAAHNNDTLVFNESNKSITSSTGLLRAMPEYVALTVYDNNYHPWDMLYVNFNDNAQEVEEDNDAAKLSGGDLNFYTMSGDNHKLSIDARPYKADKAIPVGINCVYAHDFIIKAENVAVPSGSKLYLHDKLLKQYVMLQPGTEYKFSITENSNTQGENRFELSMDPAALTPTQIAGLNVNMSPNPTTDDVKINFTNGKKEKVSVRVLDITGVSVFNQDLGLQQNGFVTIPLSGFAQGMYMVELTSGDQKVTQRLIKE